MKTDFTQDKSDNTEKTVDLHTHSTCSDGSYSPAELVRHAKNAGLSAVALTDHDNTDGLKEAKAAAEECGIEFVPGVEISVKSDAETHIVGLFIDPDEPTLKAGLERLRTERLDRNREVHEKLNALGMDMTLDEVRAEAGSTLLCRAHFARVMVKKGYVSSVKEAFDTVLGPGKPAFSSSRGMSAEEGIRLIKNAGGTAIAAHLHHIKKEGEELEKYLRELIGYGLDGVEGYYSEYTEEMAKEYRALAAKLGLILSGGTDFHGAMKPHIAIGTGFGNLKIPYRVLDGIKKKNALQKQR